MIYYPDYGSIQAANTLAEMLGQLPTAPDSTVPAGHLRVILGADYTMPATLDRPTGDNSSAASSTTSAPADPSAQRADSTTISGTGIPCVK
jgi:hypothetical protein